MNLLSICDMEMNAALPPPSVVFVFIIFHRKGKEGSEVRDTVVSEFVMTSY